MALVHLVWDDSLLSDSRILPPDSGVVYRVWWGPTSRGAQQRDTFLYPTTEALSANHGASVVVPGGATWHFSVTAVLLEPYEWVDQETGQPYILDAGETLYSNEVSAVVVSDEPIHLSFTPPRNLRRNP